MFIPFACILFLKGRYHKKIEKDRDKEGGGEGEGGEEG